LRLLNKSRAFLAGTWGLWAVFSLILISCPLNLPEKVQIKANPSLYMPVGNLLGDEKKDLGGLDELTKLKIGSSDENTPVYDYQGPEYGDTKVIMVVMKNLADEDFSSLATDLDTMISNVETAPSGSPSPFPHTITGMPSISPGTNDGIDLSDLFGTDGFLEGYPGLEFRSVPAYLYINGPARIFQDDNVNIVLEFKDSSSSPLQTEKRAVEPLALPALPALPAPPADPEPVTFTLPKPGKAIELAKIFNDAPAGLKVELNVTVGGITVDNLGELKELSAQFKSTHLTAHLVLLLPFQFTAAKPVPVMAGPDDPPNDKSAIPLVEGGGDLLGRGSGDDSMDEIMKNLGAISIEATVVNNLGINGFVLMLPKMPTESLPPGSLPLDHLGKINLSGKSMLTITKADLEHVPFSPALEIYLDGDFDIKRSPLPEEGAMTMSMAMILRTDIDMTL
jgi:hypothetical protein